MSKNNYTVLKFGGTSVGSIDRIKAIGQRINALVEKGASVVVVVSAMGKTTDELIHKAREISSSPDPREYDALISTGENISSSLLSMVLIENNIPAVSLTGPQAGVKTSSLHSKAKITHVDTGRIIKELEQGKVVVVSGFQGLNENNDVATIGRGGSDTSAVVLAAALGVNECDIFTDVDGVYTTDPRKVDSAKKLSAISYDEMLELASLGAGVLHPRAVETAKQNDIIIHVRSSFSHEEGTRVKESKEMESNRSVTGVTVNENESIISVLKVPDSPGNAGKLFHALGEAGINVDMIIQSAEEGIKNDISFSIQQDDLQKASEIVDIVSKELGAESFHTNDNIAKISAVGVGMLSRPGVAAKMFSALGDAGINILRISTSEIKISCAIAREDAKRGLAALHEAFELHKA
jgi:aspartate kinase